MESNAADLFQFTQSVSLLFASAACLLIAGTMPPKVKKTIAKVAEQINAPLDAFDTGSPRGKLQKRDWFFINWATLCSGFVAGISWVAAEAQVHLVPLLGNSGFQGMVIGMAVGFVCQAVIQMSRGKVDQFPPYRPQPGLNDPLLHRPGYPQQPPPMPPQQSTMPPQPPQSGYPNPVPPPPPQA